MVHRAQNAPRKNEKSGDSGLDIVFLGDDVIEQLSGTINLGVKDADGMEAYFEHKFTKKGGGKLEGLALGSTGDIGPNLLWHLQNGILDAKLNPKVWFIMVGGNDLFNSKCTDRFVLANTLNVVKELYNHQPDAEFIIHGILPRVDSPDGKSGKTGQLGNYWNRAQDINLEIKRFTRKGRRLHYINGGPKFTKDHGQGIKGRKFIDLNLMTNGITPTTEGMKSWGDFIEKKVLEILNPKVRLFKKKTKDEDENRRLNIR
jgi:lysophospholipase L1-like esterase